MAIAFDVENSRPKHHFNTEFISNRIYSILHVSKQKPRRFRNARGLMPRHQNTSVAALRTISRLEVIG
jgi:hypothetical protein